MIDYQVTTDLLKQYPLLNVLTEEELEEMIHVTRIQSIKKDVCLYHEGESSNALYFVIEGWFKAEKISQDGRQQTLRFIGPGEMINELAVFSNASNAVSMVAMEDAVVFSLLKWDIEAWLQKYPKFSKAVIESLASRIQQLLDHVEGLSLHTVEGRLARFLLAESMDDVWERRTWITQTEIAARLGTVLDVVNRNLQKMVKDGVIEIHREKITIIDRERLAEIAGG
jgi:CRP/FNR family transcriptional regulator